MIPGFHQHHILVAVREGKLCASYSLVSVAGIASCVAAIQGSPRFDQNYKDSKMSDKQAAGTIESQYVRIS